MMWRVLAAVGVLGWLVAALALARIDDLRLERAAADARCGTLAAVADNCDHALLSCQGWQVRVVYELEAMNAIMKERL